MTKNRWERRRESNRLKSVPILVAEFRATRVETEDDLHLATATLLDALSLHWWHCANGGKRGRVEAARFKAMGVLPGVSDILIGEDWECDCAKEGSAYPKCPVCEGRGGGHMVALELKAPGKTASDEQEDFLAKGCARGWLCAVCDSTEGVLENLRMVRPLEGRRVS